MSHQFIDEAKLRDAINVEEADLAGWAFKAMQLPEYVCFVVEVDGGELVGFLAGVIHPHFLSNATTTANELAWWVKPEHRG